MHATVSRRTAALLAALWLTTCLLAGGMIVGMASATVSDTHRTQLNTSDTTPTSTPISSSGASSTNRTRIAQDLYLLDRGADDGTASVTLHVDSHKAVTLADGAMSDEGEIPTRTVVLEPGTHTVTLDVTDGAPYAVTISTQDVLYYVPIEDAGTSLVGGPWDAQDVQTAALGGASSVAVCVVVVAIRTFTGKTDDPERIA